MPQVKRFAAHNLVKEALQKTVGKLTRPTNRRKVFQDRSNVWYVVVGGDEWHGVNKDTVEEIRAKASSAKLVIAVKNYNSITIYTGDFEPFLNGINKGLIKLTTQDQNHFHYDFGPLNEYVSVREISGYHLSRFDTIDID